MSRIDAIDRAIAMLGAPAVGALVGWLLAWAVVFLISVGAGVGAGEPLVPTPAGVEVDDNPFCVIQPRPGLSARCRIIEVYDGDTLTVELRIPVRVRLLDCWAPELRDPGGIESRDHLDELAALQDGTLWVPWDHARRAGDVWSFDRILGHVWVDGYDKPVSELQVDAGHATVERQ